MIVLAPIFVSLGVMVLATVAVLGGSPEPVDKISRSRFNFDRGELAEDEFSVEATPEQGRVSMVEPRPARAAPRRRGFSPVRGSSEPEDEAGAAPPGAEPTSVAESLAPGTDSAVAPLRGDGPYPGSKDARSRLRERMNSGRGFLGKLAGRRREKEAQEEASASDSRAAAEPDATDETHARQSTLPIRRSVRKPNTRRHQQIV